MMLKRAIRGMLPNYRKGTGSEAFSRVKCYEGFPKEFEKEKIIKISSKKYDNYIELKQLSERI
jgi:ribosomal protein L13